MVITLVSCTSNPDDTNYTTLEITEEINYNARKILLDDSEDYYLLMYFEINDDSSADYNKGHYEIYDTENSNLLHEFTWQDISGSILSGYIYGDYLVAYIRNDLEQYYLGVYDTLDPTLPLIKEFYQSDDRFSFIITDHYAIINQTVSNQGNQYNNHLMFLDLDDLSSWETEEIYNYYIDDNDQDQTVELFSYKDTYFSDRMYQVHRHGDMIYYLYRKGTEIQLYKSDINSLFVDDDLLYSNMDVSDDDDYMLEGDFFYHMVYYRDHLVYYMNIMDLSGNYLTENLEYYNKRNVCRIEERIEYCLGQGFSRYYTSQGNRLLVLENNLSDSDQENIILYYAVLEGSQAQVDANTYLIDTEISYVNRNFVGFTVGGDYLHVYTYAEDDPYHIELDRFNLIDMDRGIIYGD